jgi:hypothetical protein
MERSSHWNAMNLGGFAPQWRHFGAIQSFNANETSATVPTPASQSAANHRRR